MQSHHEPPYISHIERLSTENGPGLRTVVYFKGCSHCYIWCRTPETITADVSILFYQERCTGCGACETVCDTGAVFAFTRNLIQSPPCTGCGKCANICTSHAYQQVGEQYTPDALVALLGQDIDLYHSTGGGVTIAGGEPLLWMPYLESVFEQLRRQRISIAVHTSGDFDYAEFERRILPHIDFVYFDIKLISTTAHKKYTGVSNLRIMRNLELLVRSEQIIVIPRTPLVPGVTDAKENLSAISTYLKSLGISIWEKIECSPDVTLQWRRIGKTPPSV